MFDGTQGTESVIIQTVFLKLWALQQWYKRRKPDADCYVGEKFNDPVVHEDKCECTDLDYEWYWFV